MRPAGVVLLSFLAVPLLSAQTTATAQPDGLSILRTMSEHYATAKSWYIAATEERTSWDDYSRFWIKTVMVGAVSGNRYHFEGHSQTGSALFVSDGKTAWDVHPEEHAYTQGPAPEGGYQRPHPLSINEAAAQRAAGFLREFSDLPSHYSGATRLPDENLTLGGEAIPCYVVRVTSEQRKGPHSANDTSEKTLWIDKQTWAVRKTSLHANSNLIVAGTVHIPTQALVVTTYSTAMLTGPVPDSLFRFEPPPDAQQVAKFSDNPLAFGPDLTGRQAADVLLVGTNRKRAPLSSYRGKPVLLYFWATWCSPCIAGMPKLAALQKEAGPKGLVLLSVDEDEDAKKASDYLAQHHYTWPNTQDDGKIGDAFNKVGIPLYVLIDATGKIVFYKSGSGPTLEAALRKAIAGLGPQFAALSAGEQPQPRDTPAH